MQCVREEDSQVLHNVSGASLVLVLHYGAHTHCKSYGSPVLGLLHCSHIVSAQKNAAPSESSHMAWTVIWLLYELMSFMKATSHMPWARSQKALASTYMAADGGVR